MKTNCESELPELVVMLTYNDFTIENADDVFEQCKTSLATYWGIKEKPLPVEKMQRLFKRMKECGKTTVLEVVGYDVTEGMKGAEIAAACGCDILMGTKFHESIADFCVKHNIRYMPFVGHIEGRPSVLTGTVEEITAEARRALERGAYGIDLLGYRYVGDAVALNKAVVEAVSGPVCIAGSINSYQRLDEVRAIGAAMFTIGSAFFDNKFGNGLCQQIDNVINYLANS
ncbi:MAG: hypothetical protein K2K26_01870 [Muribaculaceae bacterium]|nr:hypothetical protein [Muribaculaceae bacterium]